MNGLSRIHGALGAALAVVITGVGCTSILGKIDFNGSGGSGGSSSSSSSTGSATATGTGGATASSSSAGTGGTGGSGTCDGLVCDPTATCEMAGSPKCVCPPGTNDVNGNGTKCVDPCKADPAPCNGNETCASANGTASCTCKAGWIGTTCDTCVFFVAGGATGAGNGASWTDAFTKIQPALDAANTSVTNGAASCAVWVEAGTYYLYVSDKKADSVHLYTNVGLYGGFAGTETQQSEADPTMNPTILSGKKSASSGPSVEHVVTAADVTGTTLDGFTLRDGDADGSGGSTEDSNGGGFLLYAFNLHGSSATVSNCVIGPNTAVYGGGIGMVFGTPTITVTGCTIRDNTATQNAGGMACNGASCTITGTTFQANTAGNTAGGLQSNSPLDADHDQFLYNVSSGDAGGAALGMTGTLTNLFFSGNSAFGIGGGISITGNGLEIDNGVFVGNVASAGGGIADATNNGSTCVNCTFTLNTGNGGGIMWQGHGPILDNTIVWGNQGPTGFADLHEIGTGVALATLYCDLHDMAGSDAHTFDMAPLFKAVPAFIDTTTFATGTMNTVKVASSSIYGMTDVIEIGGDGVARTLSSASGGTLTFSPSLGAAAPVGTEVRDWGPTFEALDLSLMAASPCVAAGDAAVAPAKDITGKAWTGTPNMGAYE